MQIVLVLAFVASVTALRPELAVRAERVASHAAVGRRAMLGIAAGALLAPTTASAKEKNYMTMDEYNKMKAEGLKDEKLYGLFESLRTRAGQTAEFDKLAEGDKLQELSKLALAWDANIRKDLLDKANESLSGKDKEAGSKLSKTILEDLKQLDKLAKAGDKAGVPSVSAALQGHVLEFVALEPTRLTDKFGIGDL